VIMFLLLLKGEERLEILRGGIGSWSQVKFN
jgi:hypothetical protein